jgi:excisionase family DNA binding protein
MAATLTAADVMTAAEVAVLMVVPRSTVEHWARQGVLPSRKIGRRRLFLRPKIEALLMGDVP